MLSRHAEDLFWMGRYMERAENTARMLDVTYHTALEAGSDRSPQDVWGDLYEVLFLDEEEVAHLDGGGSLIFDPTIEFSVRSVSTRARENARGTRELLSAEVWEGINSLHLELGRSARETINDERPYDVLRRIKAASQTVTGAVQSTLARSDPYRFIVLGQMIERAGNTVQILIVWNRRLQSSPASMAYAEWVKLLKSVSAYEAYLRRHRASITAGQVLDFLLQEDDLPRSVGHCLKAAEELIAVMAVGEVGRDCRRIAGRLRAEVEFSHPSSMPIDELSAFLDNVEEQILELAGCVQRDFFRPGSASMHVYEAF